MSPSSNKNSNSNNNSILTGLVTTSALVVISCSVAAAAATTCLWWTRHHQQQQRQRQHDDALEAAEERRKEERTGRIRAEVRLRQVSKELQQMQIQQQQQQQGSRNDNCATTRMTGNGKTTSQDGSNDNPNDTTTTMLLHCIGTVTSPYTKRMGTPRQPQLVPSSRGYIEFTCPATALDGIDAYSHVWIIFEFHANTNHLGGSKGTPKKTKIRPPRAGGAKVGQLATRSPHRPNPIGLSLVQIDSWHAATRRLHIKGLDLVHGTPVYDIKPCVPWDVPSTVVRLRVPSWVQANDALVEVIFADQAQADLGTRLVEGALAPLYHDTDLVAARQTLTEILAQDPRSSHKGLKVNARGSTTGQEQEAYNLIFGQTQVFFRVQSDAAVLVERIEAIDFASSTFVDGVPLIMANDNQTS